MSQSQFLPKDISQNRTSLSAPSPTNFHDYAIFDVMVAAAIYIILGIIILVNKCKFSHVALVNIPSYPLSLRGKILAILVLVCLYVISAILAFFDEEFWANKANPTKYGFMYLIPVIISIFNIDWLKYQFERKIPLVWYQNQLVWVLLSICHLMAFVSGYLTNRDKRTWGVDEVMVLFKLTVTLMLMIYTFRRPQDIEEYFPESGLHAQLLAEKQSRAGYRNSMTASWWRGRSRRDSNANAVGGQRKRRLTNSRLAEEHAGLPLTVTVVNKVQRREDPSSGAMEIIYKLHILTGKQDYKILRTLNDFKRLENSLLMEERKDPNRSFVSESLNAVFADPEAENMSNVSFIVLTLQNFINALLKNDKASKNLINFLEVPDPERTRLLNWSKDSPGEMEEQDAENLDDIEEDDKEHPTEFTEPDMAQSQNSSYRLTRASERDYCPFFNVNIPKYKKANNGDYIEYQIYLQLIEKPDEAWQIRKRYSDFVDLRRQLVSVINAVPPKLPSKLMLMTEEDQREERRKGLESWLRIVLNEKIYFRPQLMNFIEINPSYSEWLKDEDAYDFSRFTALIDNNQILMSNNKPYTVYHIVIEEKNSAAGPGKKKLRYSLLRRYKEFDMLYQALQTRFSHAPAKLPELPPKYTTFSNKTTVDFRQQGLERFINSLFNYPNIGDSFAFRKFINFKKGLEEKIMKEETERSASDLVPSNKEEIITNVRIDKSLSTARSKTHFQKNFAH